MELHPEILSKNGKPEFVVLPVASTSEAYGAWLLESTAR